MEKIMSHCGLICSDCNAYKATVNNDDALRKQTAEEWGKMYGTDIKAGDLNCLGCKSDLLFGYCNICEIRKCNKESNYQNCSECASFDCGNLKEVFKYDPGARERLLKLRG